MARFVEPLQPVRADSVDADLATANRNESSGAGRVLPIVRLVCGRDRDGTALIRAGVDLVLLDEPIARCRKQSLDRRSLASAQAVKLGHFRDPNSAQLA